MCNITGIGVFATRSFNPNEFLMEYRGERDSDFDDDTYVFQFGHDGNVIW